MLIPYGTAKGGYAAMLSPAISAACHHASPDQRLGKALCISGQYSGALAVDTHVHPPNLELPLQAAKPPPTQCTRMLLLLLLLLPWVLGLCCC
jgi:hypothetical protein